MPLSPSPRLVLASESPRRIGILRSLGVEFDVVPSGCDESYRGETPESTARVLALHKATSVADRLGDGLVVGSDTLIDFDGAVVGKPDGPADAVATLRMLSGKAHIVRTAVAIADARTGRTEVGAAATTVRMRALTDTEIQAYVDTGEPLDKAGSYAVQGKGGRLVESIDGPEDNVIGFPVDVFIALMKRFSAWPHGDGVTTTLHRSG